MSEHYILVTTADDWGTLIIGQIITSYVGWLEVVVVLMAGVYTRPSVAEVAAGNHHHDGNKMVCLKKELITFTFYHHW